MRRGGRLRRRTQAADERPRIRFAPVEPPDPEWMPEVRLTAVPGAIVTPFEIVATGPGDHQKSVGAVYTAQRQLVGDSQRVGGIQGDHVVPVDPPTTDVRPERQLAGCWLYVGNWMAHFGHFLTETLTTLWLRTGGIDGLLAHPFIFPQREPSPTELALAAAAGYPDPPRVVEEPLRVESLLVPTRPYVPNAVAAPEAVHPWNRTAASAPPAGVRHVFLSRTRFHQRRLETRGRPHRRAFANEVQLDELMRSRGFEVVHPEELDVREQIGLARGADVLAGVSGTAVHLSAFAGSGTRVLELGDARAPRGLPNQHVISAVRGHPYAVVPFVADATAGRRAVDLRHVAAHLDALEL